MGMQILFGLTMLFLWQAQANFNGCSPEFVIPKIVLTEELDVNMDIEISWGTTEICKD